MRRKIINPNYIDVRPPRPAASSERSGSRLLTKAAVAAGSLALAITTAAARPNMAAASPPMKEVGVFEPLLLSRDLSQSETVAQMIKAAGFNSVEIRENYVQWEAGNVENDWQAFCNAAQAAEDNNLHEYVTFQTYYTQGQPGSEINGGRGFMPTSLTDYKKFNTTMNTYLAGLSGPTAEQAPDQAHRCAGLKVPMTNVEFSFINEPNDPQFVTQRLDAQGNNLIPADLANLYAYEYPRLKATAKKFGVQLIIAAGGLNPNITDGVSNLDFIQQMGEAVQSQDIKGRIFDEWDIHPYTPGGTPQTVHPNASDIGPSDVPMLSNSLKNAFGWRPAIVGGEYGVEPWVPAGRTNLYGSIFPNVSSTDETGQAQQYHDTLAILACTPKTNGLYFFHLIDNYPAMAWGRSGIFYPDGTPKSSAVLVEQAVAAAENGTIANCQNPHR